MALRWGIATAGKISHDFATALGTLSADEHKIVAIAARDLDRAKEFATTHGIANTYKGYDGLAKDQNVDIVYVGNLNPQHYEVAKLMLDNGKHVLVEKPMCMNEREARNLIDLAKKKKLFLMEAIWSRFFPAYQYAKERIDSGALGDIVEVNVEFGFEIANVERLAKKSLGGGTILDLGVYVIQVSQFALRQAPTLIKASGSLNEDGCDLSMNAELRYDGGKVAHIATSALKQLSNKAIIKGTKGSITLIDFWCPTALIDIDGNEKTWPLPEAKFEFNFQNSCGLRYEAEAVRKCIMNKKLECDVVSHNESLIIARIEDEIRKQVGVVYDVDDEE